MLSKSEKIREEIKYYERERNDWKINIKMFHAEDKIQELDNKIKELQDKLYDVEFKELLNEEGEHNKVQG